MFNFLDVAGPDFPVEPTTSVNPAIIVGIIVVVGFGIYFGLNNIGGREEISLDQKVIRQK